MSKDSAAAPARDQALRGLFPDIQPFDSGALKLDARHPM